MKLLIAGSRTIEAFDLSPYVPPETEIIICGGATGANQIAEQYADQKNISKLVLRPFYRKYGRGAPLKRNEIMVDLADEVLILWDGSSRGTKYTIDYSKKKEKPITIISVKSNRRPDP